MRSNSFEFIFIAFRIWENRERKKAKDYERVKEKELKREEKREKEAKIMKEFLEDYDDERDDPKYYKFVFTIRSNGLVSNQMFID